MKKIAIVGAGQSGLQLGFELLNKGYHVTLYSDKDACEIFNSAAPPVPIQFYPSLGYEKELGIDFWKSEPATHIDGVRFDLYTTDGTKAFTIEAPLKIKAQTIDLRLKFSEWLNEFKRRGGNLIIEKGTIALLEEITVKNDAVFVATGKGELSQLFKKDEKKTVFDKPQRHLALFYAKNCQLNYMNDPTSGGSSYNIMEGVGELIMSPFLSKNKERIFYILFEAIPGGPMDFFDRNADAAGQLELTKKFLKDNYPPLFQMIKDASLAGKNEWVCGAVTPTVKCPVGVLPSGNVVMAMGDLLILNDPILAQGLNGASKFAHYIAERIVKSEDKKFDAEWITEVTEGYWQTAQYNNAITTSMLQGAAPHQQELLFAASQNPSIAADFVNGIGQAHVMYPWFGDPNEAKKYLDKKALNIVKEAAE
ncbi:hypothetical protein GCM10009122_52200 [Fulvivirga kasyanovii]|uniref:Oxygenase n=1 Tax=Fulvivirga kasyanovii TaxID=396812 RepID=A0ABW9RJF8_9BACT|nr:styrene monooxygenase/indole monooxygenase family protein [Fulvivirga kasyanovii]MTI24217.1 oxygenase [Fulvivirga kasyanovii]